MLVLDILPGLGILFELGIMQLLALDIGQTRVGVAVSVGSPQLASPLCVLPYQEVVALAPSFRRIVDDWQPDMLLCGLPYSLDGSLGSQAKKTQHVAQSIANCLHLPIEFVDERLSSKQAKQLLHDQGMNEKQMRGKIDMVAASIFLDTWLQQQQNEKGK